MDLKAEFNDWEQRIDQVLRKNSGLDTNYRSLIMGGGIDVFFRKKTEEGTNFLLSGKISGIDAYEYKDEKIGKTIFVVYIHIDYHSIPCGRHRLERIELREDEPGGFIVLNPPLLGPGWENGFRFCDKRSILA